MAWPDVEKLASVYFAGTLAARVVTRLPADLEQHLPVVRVTRGPGDDDGITDAPLLDVEVFASDRSEMWDLSEDARQAAHALAGQAIDGALVDSVSTAVGPTWVSYENPAVQRTVASYRLALRQL